MSSAFKRVPKHIIKDIFSFLALKDLQSCAQVNKDWSGLKEETLNERIDKELKEKYKHAPEDVHTFINELLKSKNIKFKTIFLSKEITYEFVKKIMLVIRNEDKIELEQPSPYFKLSDDLVQGLKIFNEYIIDLSDLARLDLPRLKIIAGNEQFKRALKHELLDVNDIVNLPPVQLNKMLLNLGKIPVRELSYFKQDYSYKSYWFAHPQEFNDYSKRRFKECLDRGDAHANSWEAAMTYKDRERYEDEGKYTRYGFKNRPSF